ncbi:MULTISPECIES: DUF4235 domain-containing protein [unclassified Luteococcus]|uniref:DUF4235 domain-containing protein n=1 Tax=unclassified Luteococcus TaxID=2639923 RepID=UPI00313DEE74
MASTSQNIGFKIYAGVLGAVTTVVTQKLISAAWKVATGDTPPDPNDPDVPPTQAAIWALASGLGLGVSQLALNRFVGRRFEEVTGEHLDKTGNLKIKL